MGLCKAVLMERVAGRMAGKGRTLEYLKLEEIPWVICMAGACPGFEEGRC